MNAFFDQEVVLLTFSGAKDRKDLGIPLQFGNEVIDDAVIRALANNISKSEYPGVNPKEMAIG